MKFPADTNVRLTVIDPNNSANTFTKTIAVQRKGSLAILENNAIFAQIDIQTKITATKKITQTGIICALGKAEKCSLNFTGEKSIGAKSWFWDFGNGSTSDKENPGAQNF